jgi:hypothetical protein
MVAGKMVMMLILILTVMTVEIVAQLVEYQDYAKCTPEVNRLDTVVTQMRGSSVSFQLICLAAQCLTLELPMEFVVFCLRLTQEYSDAHPGVAILLAMLCWLGVFCLLYKKAKNFILKIRNFFQKEEVTVGDTKLDPVTPSAPAPEDTQVFQSQLPLGMKTTAQYSYFPWMGAYTRTFPNETIPTIPEQMQNPKEARYFKQYNSHLAFPVRDTKTLTLLSAATWNRLGDRFYHRPREQE